MMWFNILKRRGRMQDFKYFKEAIHTIIPSIPKNTKFTSEGIIDKVNELYYELVNKNRRWPRAVKEVPSSQLSKYINANLHTFGLDSQRAYEKQYSTYTKK